MKRLVLTEPVHLTGPNFLGFNSTLTIEPSTEDSLLWRCDPNHSKIVEIGPAYLARNPRRIALLHAETYQGRVFRRKLNVVEHILPIRMLGVSGCLISCNSKWPPYDGSTEALWNVLKPRLKEAGDLEWVSFRGSPLLCESRGNPYRYVQFHPAGGKRRLTIEVFIDYPGLNDYTETFVIPDDMERLVKARSPLWPAWWEKVRKTANCFGVGPQADCFVQPDFENKKKTPEVRGTPSARHRGCLGRSNARRHHARRPRTLQLRGSRPRP